MSFGVRPSTLSPSILILHPLPPSTATFSQSSLNTPSTPSPLHTPSLWNQRCHFQGEDQAPVWWRQSLNACCEVNVYSPRFTSPHRELHFHSLFYSLPLELMFTPCDLRNRELGSFIHSLFSAMINILHEQKSIFTVKSHTMNFKF